MALECALLTTTFPALTSPEREKESKWFLKLRRNHPSAPMKLIQGKRCHPMVQEYQALVEDRSLLWEQTSSSA